MEGRADNRGKGEGKGVKTTTLRVWRETMDRGHVLQLVQLLQVYSSAIVYVHDFFGIFYSMSLLILKLFLSVANLPVMQQISALIHTFGLTGGANGQNTRLSLSCSPYRHSVQLSGLYAGLVLLGLATAAYGDPCLIQFSSNMGMACVHLRLQNFGLNCQPNFKAFWAQMNKITNKRWNTIVVKMMI